MHQLREIYSPNLTRLELFPVTIWLSVTGQQEKLEFLQFIWCRSLGCSGEKQMPPQHMHITQEFPTPKVGPEKPVHIFTPRTRGGRGVRGSEKKEKEQSRARHSRLWVCLFAKGISPERPLAIPFCLWDGKCYSAARPLANCGFLFLFPITLSHA